MNSSKTQLLAGLMLAAAGEAAAEGLDSLQFAIAGGAYNVDGRMRYESVDQDNAMLNADAATVRVRLGYTTRKWNYLDAAAEYEGVTYLGDEQYDNNPGPTGRAGYSVVADPHGSELNQAWIRFTGIPQTTIKAGRQRLIFDNARYIGNVGWRQNEQTYDGYLATNTSIPRTTVNYGFLTNANTIFFSDFRMHGHVVNVAVAPAPVFGLTGYAYLLDFDVSTPRTDSQTLGARAGGAIPLGEAVKLNYTLEYADQSAYADAPSTVDASYALGEVGLSGFNVYGKLSYEVLGGDGVYGFQTPLATLHAFQGWADVFLTTPAAGIRDSYATLGGTLMQKRIGLLAMFHQYEADEGGAELGSELNVQATYAYTPALAFGAKYADYSADTFAVDTRKGWVWAEYKF